MRVTFQWLDVDELASAHEVVVLVDVDVVEIVMFGREGSYGIGGIDVVVISGFAFIGLVEVIALD